MSHETLFDISEIGVILYALMTQLVFLYAHVVDDAIWPWKLLFAPLAIAAIAASVLMIPTFFPSEAVTLDYFVISVAAFDTAASWILLSLLNLGAILWRVTKGNKSAAVAVDARHAETGLSPS
jgi:hypothetical protein